MLKRHAVDFDDSRSAISGSSTSTEPSEPERASSGEPDVLNDRFADEREGAVCRQVQPGRRVTSYGGVFHSAACLLTVY
ncbi:unnamed protein product [Ixodes persulcatus]